MTDAKRMPMPEPVHTHIPPARKRLLGLRRSAILEVLLSLAALLLIDHWWLDQSRYWSVNPHPFWFVLLLVAGKYGTREALFAAVMCSAALLIGNIPAQTMQQDIYAYTLYVLKLPLMWLVAAVIFGELRQMHINERNKLEAALKGSEEREQYIAQSYQWVRDLKDQMEVRMAGQLRSSIRAYQAARSMETMSSGNILRGLEDLVRTALHPQQFSIYTLNKDGLELSLSQGWEETDAHSKHFPPESALYQSIVGRQEVLSVVQLSQEEILAGQGILAGPLIDKVSGEVVGMLKIEKIAFTDLHLSNIEAFGTICEWAGMALVNARKYHKAKAESMVNPDHNLLTHTYLQRYIDYSMALARRIGFDLAMITIQLDRPEEFSREQHIRIAHALTESVDSVLRHIDLAFDYQEEGGAYAIVLPATGREGAGRVLGKIREALMQRTGDTPLIFTVQMMYEKSAT